MTDSALNVTGSWEYTIDTPMGEMTVYLIVKERESEYVAGSEHVAGSGYVAWLANDMLGEIKADHVSVTGARLGATFTIMGQTSTLDVTFTADAFTGTHVLPMLTAQVTGRRGSMEDRIKAATEALEARDRVAIPRRTPEEIAAQVASLLAQMTLDEKIGQLVQIHAVGAPTGPGEPPARPHDLIQAGKVGSLLGNWSPLLVYELQKAAVDESRLGIPLLFMSDVIHGYKTIYPIPLATACSWDMDAITQVAQMTARECAVSGISITFAPMLDLVRDARWGRVMESPGEDPYLGACVGEAFVAGFQGDDWRKPAAIGTCAKHFAAYGATEGGREYNTVDVSERVLREFYLPAFKQVADAGVTMFMTAFNVYDGIPATANEFLMKQVLREEWGFDGVLISDHSAVAEIAVPGIAHDLSEAAHLAMKATMDIEMATMGYAWHLKDLVENGQVEKSQIDAAVRRVLTLKMALGLFDDPYRHIDFDAHKKLPLSAEHRAICRDMVTKSAVLLKNDPVDGEPVLPLSKRGQRLALVGPYATNKSLLGSWSASGSTEPVVSLAEGIEAKLADESGLLLAEGCTITEEIDGGFEQAAAVAAKADVVVLALGEDTRMTGEAASRTDITLPPVQRALAQEIVKMGKPAVLVLFNGRPLVLNWFHENERILAILEGWFPGTEGGNGLADLLFGDVNPSGKLAMSFPYTLGQVPIYYNHYNTGRPLTPEDADSWFVSRYLDSPNEPLYPFGYGLSYTTFSYSGVALSRTEMRPGEHLEVAVTLANTGPVAGTEVVQLYLRDEVGSVVRPVKELKGFQRVTLAPGESRAVTFRLTEAHLAFYTADMSFRAEPGRFVVMVGSSSVDIRATATFTLTR
jgi:beta-glucosidase